jgi:hypothetical protein
MLLLLQVLVVFHWQFVPGSCLTQTTLNSFSDKRIVRNLWVMSDVWKMVVLSYLTIMVVNSVVWVLRCSHNWGNKGRILKSIIVIIKLCYYALRSLTLKVWILRESGRRLNCIIIKILTDYTRLFMQVIAFCSWLLPLVVGSSSADWIHRWCPLRLFIINT